MHLGQALYKVCNHLWIVAKVSTDSMRQILTNQSLQVGHITCDNARNNDTMLEEFAHCYQAKTVSKFDIKRRQIRYVSFRLCSCGTQSTKYRCLAHIINIATQAVILYLLIANQSFTMAILMMTTSLKMHDLSHTVIAPSELLPLSGLLKQIRYVNSFKILLHISY